MTFFGSFQKPFLTSKTDAPIFPWWLAGGIDPAHCIAAWQPKGATSLAASYINLANPGVYDAVPGITPGWSSATGWMFDGAGSYLSTAVPFDSGWSIFVSFVNLARPTLVDRSMLGYYAGGTQYLDIDAVSPSFIAPAYGTSGSFLSLITTGVYGFLGGGFYENTTLLGSVSGTLGSPISPLFIGALNLFGIPARYTAYNLTGLSIYDFVISTTQKDELVAAMAAL